MRPIFYVFAECLEFRHGNRVAQLLMRSYCNRCMPASDSPKSGRVRSLQEARRALGVPAAEEAVGLAGVPRNRVVAFPVHDEASPEIAAEFAAEIVLNPNGRELRKSDDRRIVGVEPQRGTDGGSRTARSWNRQMAHS